MIKKQLFSWHSQKVKQKKEDLRNKVHHRIQFLQNNTGFEFSPFQKSSRNPSHQGSSNGMPQHPASRTRIEGYFRDFGSLSSSADPRKKTPISLDLQSKKKPSRPSGFSDKHAQVHSRFIALLMFANATFQRSRIDDFPKFKHHWRSMLLFHRFLLVGVACVYLEEMVHIISGRVTLLRHATKGS